MTNQIFISLTQQDSGIANALLKAINQLFGDMITVHFSTSKELKGGIRHGEDWFQWIVKRVQECDFALVLLTPASIQKPWILWEAGAVYGAATAMKKEGIRKVRPLIYQLETAQIPSPIRDSKAQYRRGDNAEEVEALLRDIIDQYRDSISTDKILQLSKNLDGTIEKYLSEIRDTLLNAPLIPSNVVIEEWRIRLDKVMRSQRMSEIEHLHHWMDIAFGVDIEGESQPIDLRIHSRLGEIYLEAKKYEKAIQQFRLARQLAPRDIFVLRTLGKAYLDSGKKKEAKNVIDRIEELDKDAIVKNVESAALAGRWHREEGDLAAAEKVFKNALSKNTDSYYLANVLAETRLEAKDQKGAEVAFQKALSIIEELSETNIWTHATALNAAFFIGDYEKAKSHAQSIFAQSPTSGESTTIESGLKRIASELGRLKELKAVWGNTKKS